MTLLGSTAVTDAAAQPGRIGLVMGMALALTSCGGSSSSCKVVTRPARTTGTSTTVQPLPIQQQHAFVLYGEGLTASCGSHNHLDPSDRSDVEGDVNVGLIPAVRSSNPHATITLIGPTPPPA